MDICYLQLDQLNVIIEDSRWQLLYLVVIQGPKKRYSMSLVKIYTTSCVFSAGIQFFRALSGSKKRF